MDMNSKHKINEGPAAGNQRRAFTLVELPIFLVILAVLIGVLLPAVQRTREANNQTAAQADLKAILAAEKTFFQAHVAYSSSLSLLGLAATFNANNQADGYIFSITVSNTLYTVTATPVAPGLTGSIDYRSDQTEKIYESPDSAAINQHVQTTDAIETEAMQVAAQAIQETDTNQTDIPTITHALMAANTVSEGFKAFAPNGKLTTTGILSYTGTGQTEIAPLLAAIQSDYQWGAGGEKIGNISLTSSEVSSGDAAPYTIGGVLTISWSGSDDVSPIAINSFSAGSVRDGTLGFHDPQLFTTVTLNQIAGGGPGFVLSGPLTITDIFGHEFGGFVCGELLPAVQTGTRATNGDPHFEALVIALDDTGVMTGGAGFGGMTLYFKPVGEDPTSGTLVIDAPR
jgi:type II secretory pathway pseudopilin PulG